MTYLMGYCDPWSAAPGQALDFKVSCDIPGGYRADVVRVLSANAGPAAPPFRLEPVPTAADGAYPGRYQRMHAGSWGIVPAHPAFAGLGDFTAVAVIWPTRPGHGRQAILGTWSEQAQTGWGLALDASGAVEFVCGTGSGAPLRVSAGAPCLARHWYWVGVSVDAAGQVRLFHEPLAGRNFHPARSILRDGALTGAITGAENPLLVAAWHAGEATGPTSHGSLLVGGHFNGKIEAPRLARGALGRDAMIEMLGDARSAELQHRIVGDWDFALGISTDEIRDRGPHGLHGTLVNLPTRAVTGRLWDGSENDWTRRPEHYAAIHFHDDDTADARWETDFTLVVPEGLKSGYYAVRLTAGETLFYIPFFVRPAKGQPKARAAFLASTATYIVYTNYRKRFVNPRAELTHGRLTVMDATDIMYLDHPEMGLSTYDTHSDGSGVCYASRYRPNHNVRPDGYLWNYCDDCFLIDWLDRTGEAVDVITDEDLHLEGPELLRGYQVLITGHHPEYFSLRMLDAVDGFVRQGGRLMYMGGNGFYWRIAHHPTRPGILEVRRSEDGLRAWDSEPGEYHHSFTGEYGGLWRRRNRAPQMLTGVGFISQGFDACTYYRRQPGSHDPRAAFIFAGIADELIGDFGVLRGGAAGLEIDCVDPRLGTPPHALVLASSENHSNVYDLVSEEINIPHGAMGALHNPKIRADLVFFETPNGGAVFSTGSCAFAGSLGHNGFDNNIARLSTNVLERFLDPTPFELPMSGGDTA